MKKETFWDKLKKINLEKILRSRILWLCMVPLFIFFTFVMLIHFNLFGKISLVMDFDFAFRIFYVGVVNFPLGIIYGIFGSMLKQYHLPSVAQKIIIFIPYILYGAFIFKIKKIKKKTLYWLSIIIFLLILIGIRGGLRLMLFNPY